MGRFDALSNLDKTPEKLPVKKVDTRQIAEELQKPPSDDLKQSAYFPKNTQAATSPLAKQPVEKNHEIMNSGNPEKTLPTSLLLDKPEKYSTLLHSDIIKKLKLHATELDLKDYECLEMILTKYFDENK